MSVLVVGLSHRSAPVEVLERLSVAPGDVSKLLEEMLEQRIVTWLRDPAGNAFRISAAAGS